MSPQILALDVAGAPHRWLNVRQAAHYYATGMVAWTAGTNEFVLRGGVQRSTGMQSKIAANSIIAIKGPRPHGSQLRAHAVPDQERCCSLAIATYVRTALSASSTTSWISSTSSRGGKSKGEDMARGSNLVAACKACNHRKANRTPEVAGMKLHYVPYAPNRFEAFILSNRRILADQMEFLLVSVVARGSRVQEGNLRRLRAEGLAPLGRARRRVAAARAFASAFAAHRKGTRGARNFSTPASVMTPLARLNDVARAFDDCSCGRFDPVLPTVACMRCSTPHVWSLTWR